MARIQYSSSVAEIRGSISGTTFQRNGFGFSVKQKKIKVNPSTVLQQRSKYVWRSINSNWLNMSASDKLSWSTYLASYPQYSKNDPTVVISGFNLYTMWNRHNRLRIYPSKTILVTCGFVAPFITVPTLTLRLLAGPILRFTISWSNSSFNGNTNIFMTKPLGSGINFYKNDFKYVKSILGPGTSLTVTTEYLAVMSFLPAIGDVIGVRYQIEQSSGGFVGPKIDQLLTVTA